DTSAESKERAAKKVTVDNLKRIGMAMWDYDKRYKTLPPAAIVDKNGKPLLSWRVLILPFLKEEGLYKEFKLNEPWDSQSNKLLLHKMPKVYGDSDGKTRFRVFVGGGSAFEWGRGLDARHFPDGTSNTIMAVEGRDLVEWTKPDEFEYGPNKRFHDWEASLSPNDSIP